MFYFLLKMVHIIGAAVLLGTGAGIAFFMLVAHLRGDPREIAGVARTVVLADFLFTASAVVLQPITGTWLAWSSGYSLRDGWIAASIALYLVTGACWLPVVWMQMQMRDLAVRAVETNAKLPAPVLPTLSMVVRLWISGVRSRAGYLLADDRPPAYSILGFVDGPHKRLTCSTNPILGLGLPGSRSDVREQASTGGRCRPHSGTLDPDQDTAWQRLRKQKRRLLKWSQAAASSPGREIAKSRYHVSAHAVPRFIVPGRDTGAGSLRPGRHWRPGSPPFGFVSMNVTPNCSPFTQAKARSDDRPNPSEESTRKNSLRGSPWTEPSTSSFAPVSETSLSVQARRHVPSIAIMSAVMGLSNDTRCVALLSGIIGPALHV
ncbi:putative membrane protein [Bradyrhizobium sp. LM6.10]